MWIELEPSQFDATTEQVVGVQLLFTTRSWLRLQELPGAGSFKVNNVYPLGYRISLPQAKTCLKINSADIPQRRSRC